jgi:hypothetical protein
MLTLNMFTFEIREAREAYSEAKYRHTQEDGPLSEVTRTGLALMAAWDEAKIIEEYFEYCSPDAIVEAWHVCNAEADFKIRKGMLDCHEREREIRAAAAEQSEARWAKADAEYLALKTSR